MKMNPVSDFISSKHFISGTLLCLTFAFCSFGGEGNKNAKLVSGDSGPAQALILEGKAIQCLVETNRKFDEKQSFGLYCIIAPGAEGYLKTVLTNSTIRIEYSTNNILCTKYCILDKVTKRSARKFWAKVISISKDSAVVHAGWYTGPLASEVISFNFSLKNGKWILVSQEPILIS